MDEKKGIKKLQKIIAGCALGFAIVFVVAIFSFVSLGKARRASAEYDKFIETLETQEAELKSGVDDVSTSEYLEEQARNYLGMIKEGETLYIFE